MELNSDMIEQILPHRYPFLLVDRITECESGVYAVGRKCVTANEMQFMGHFPGRHIMPGVLLIEALAQTGAVAILTKEENRGKLALFGGIRNAKFKRQVIPGDVVELRCELIKSKGNVGIGRATACVEGEVAVTAELIFAVDSCYTESDNLEA